MTAQALSVAFTPEGPWTNEQLAAFNKALETWHKAKEVMNMAEMADFVGIGQTKLYSIPKEVFPYHTLPGIKRRFYLRSEIIEKIRKS